MVMVTVMVVVWMSHIAAAWDIHIVESRDMLVYQNKENFCTPIQFMRAQSGSMIFRCYFYKSYILNFHIRVLQCSTSAKLATIMDKETALSSYKKKKQILDHNPRSPTPNIDKCSTQ